MTGGQARLLRKCSGIPEKAGVLLLSGSLLNQTAFGRVCMPGYTSTARYSGHRPGLIVLIAHTTLDDPYTLFSDKLLVQLHEKAAPWMGCFAMKNFLDAWLV